MSLRIRHLPVLLAIGTLAACSDGSPVAPPVVPPVVPQPQANLFASPTDPGLLSLLASEEARIAAAQNGAGHAYEAALTAWRRLNQPWVKGRHGLLNCEPQPYAATAKVVGPEGGVLDFGLHKLEIPPGALAGYTVITAEMPVSRSVSAKFAPHGMTFLVAPALALSYRHCSRPVTLLERVVYTDGIEGAVLEAPPSSDDTENARTLAWLSHFSIYALAE